MGHERTGGARGGLRLGREGVRGGTRGGGNGDHVQPDLEADGVACPLGVDARGTMAKVNLALRRPH